MMERMDTVVIGSGQAGLAISYFLTQQGREHVVLEQHDIGQAWRTRWDSFTLVTPNWTLKLPGHAYAGDDLDGFLLREEVVHYLEDYQAKYKMPVRSGMRVTSLERRDGDSTFLVKTDRGDFQATNAVVATGLFQRPKIPPYSANLSSQIAQIHTSEYRNPGALSKGAVLVVGSGQSGCQIALELNESGRKVYLCVGSASRLPRRYRGHDGVWWVNELGRFDQTVADLDSPKGRFAGNAHASGRDGGIEINLHNFAHDGIVLLGHLRDIDGTVITLAPDLRESLAKADEWAAKLKSDADELIRTKGINAEPPDGVPEPLDGYETDIVTELDLQTAGVTTLIWATGFGFDFSWVRFPVFDEDGFPIQQQGVTNEPGLYFVGLHFLYKRKSGLFLGVGEDARNVAEHIAARS